MSDMSRGRGSLNAVPAPFGAVEDLDAPLKRLLNKARRQYESGLYEGAVDTLAEFEQGSVSIANASQMPAARARLLLSAGSLAGRALLRLGRRDDAAARCRRAVAVVDRVTNESPAMSDDRDSLADLGIALCVCGDRDPDAVDYLKRAVTAGSESAETYRFLGLAQYRLGSHASAVESLDKALELDPGNIDVLTALTQSLEVLRTPNPLLAQRYILLASALVDAGRFDEALQACRRGVELFPNTYSEAGMGAILAMQGNYKEALDAFTRALALDSSNSHALFNQGETLRMLRRDLESVEILSKVPEQAAEFTLALGSLGAALNALGRHEEALQASQHALAEDSRNDFALEQKVEALLGLGRDDEAIELCRQAAELDPPPFRIVVKLSQLLFQRNENAQALAAADRALAIDAHSATALGIKGAALLELGRADEAIEPLDEAIRLAPTYVFGMERKGAALAQVGRREEAVEVFRHLIAANADDNDSRLNLADNLRLLGRFDEALVEIDELLARRADDAVALGTKGQILVGLKRREEGVALLGRSLELNPQLEWARRDLAHALRYLSRHEQSLATFNDIIARDPDDVDALSWKGEQLFNLERYDEAIIALDRALALKPDYPLALGTKGEVLSAQGKPADAIELLEKALAADAERVRRGGEGSIKDWAQLDLAENLRIVGRSDEALTHYDEMLAANPERVNALGGKAAALVSLERHEEALPILERALAIEPEYVFGISIKAAALSDGGQHEQAADLLTGAMLDGDLAAAYSLRLKGFACRVLRRYDEAKRVLEHAVAIERDDLSAQQALADVCRSTGERDRAREMYKRIIDAAAGDTAPETLAMVGWCHMWLDNYDSAVQSLVDAVSRGQKMTYAQFDLALTLLCSRREELAVREYERGIQMAANDSVWRRRGLFRLALTDFAEARLERPAAFVVHEQVAAIEEKLRTALASLPPVTVTGVAATAAP